jgi:enolase
MSSYTGRWEDEGYVFHKAGGQRSTPAEMVDLYAALVEKYPIVSMEDRLADNDWSGWWLLTERRGLKIMPAGDDIS